MKFRVAVGSSVLLLLLCAAMVSAESAAPSFSQQKTPARGEPRSIGDYSAGCLQGAKALPLDGAGYQVMHPSRLRYYGHPALVDFIQTLGRAAQVHELAAMLIGDLSQPRGGRATGGHASHQTGLDVDIWFWHPKSHGNKTLSDAQRETLKARSVLDGKDLLPEWSARVTELLRLTASDARVERVFVHPIIKRALCSQVTGERAWLSKIRPWYGHDDHFHVRLHCPSDSPDCAPQGAPPAGDGCGDELAYWFSDAAREDRKRGEQDYQSKVAGGRQPPAQCAKLLLAE